jgi:hypothetical protein
MTLGRLRRYFKDVRDEYVRLHCSVASDSEGGDGPEAMVARRLKQGLGGGFEEYRRFEKLFHDFSGMDEKEMMASTRVGASPEIKPQTTLSAGSDAGAEQSREISDTKAIKREGDVDALLLAAEGVSAQDAGAGGNSGDRWMAINTPRQQQQPPPPPQQAQGSPQGQAFGGYLASLASCAAGQEPMPQNNASTPSRPQENPPPPQPSVQTPVVVTPPPSSKQQQQQPPTDSSPLMNMQHGPPPPPPAPPSQSMPQQILPQQQYKAVDDKRRTMEHEQLQRELDKGERCGGGAEDLAVFVNGRGIEEWGDEGWLGGKIWEGK